MDEANCHVAALRGVRGVCGICGVQYVLEGVGDPVRDEARYAPFSGMAGDGVEISVCPVGATLVL
jgi:hypothetical protein